jgi:threonine dehydratase
MRHVQLRYLATLVTLLLAASAWADRAGTYPVQRTDRRMPDYLRVSRTGIQAAERRISKKVDLPTPLVYSPALSKRYGVEIYLKLESTTPVGSFKIRGALNKVLSLKGGDRKRGVVAASTGNHAQGVAWAAREAGIPATIVMPEGASPLKADKTRHLGAEVRLEGENYGKSVEIAEQLARRDGRTFISGYEDRRIVEGQGTIGREILKQLPDVDWVLGALGGGGLMGGIASAGHGLARRPVYIGVQSANNAPMLETLRRTPAEASHARLPKVRPTIADGTMVTEKPSPRMADLLRSRLDLVVKVTERSAGRAVLELLDRAGQRVEGAGALPLAGLQRALADLERNPALRGVARPKKVVLVLSGGNIDQAKLDHLREQNAPAAR